MVSPNAASTATNAIAATTTYTVTITDSATGCTATSTVTVNVPTITAANNGPVCVGSPINFTATPAGATSYAWAGQALHQQTATAAPSIAVHCRRCRRVPLL
ncbi:MAG: hypothetical protein IPN94_16620 [Sphingobacteriales bacterium]|nr:hypothetical protein [Sphingobacteriales bacterium]